MTKLPLNEFYKENENLIHFSSQKALRRFAAAGLGERVEYEEIFGELSEVFIKSYNQFDPKQSKFSTYFVTAGHNHVTNRIEKMYRLDIKLDSLDAQTNEDGESFSLLDTAYGYDSMIEGEVALESELNHLREKLSPFAQTLLDCSINPPQFMLDEFHAQRAQCAWASANGFKTSHSTEINLQFVANCLRMTTNNPETMKFIRSAVDEVKHAVHRAVSA